VVKSQPKTRKQSKSLQEPTTINDPPQESQLEASIGLDASGKLVLNLQQDGRLIAEKALSSSPDFEKYSEERKIEYLTERADLEKTKWIMEYSNLVPVPDQSKAFFASGHHWIDPRGNSLENFFQKSRPARS